MTDRDVMNRCLATRAHPPGIAGVIVGRPFRESAIANVSGWHVITTTYKASVAKDLKQQPGSRPNANLSRHGTQTNSTQNQSATIGTTNRTHYLARPSNTIHYLITIKVSNEMAIQKQILINDRVRRPPTDGFSWVDRRFLREFAVRLSGDAVFLYLFLTAVSDKHGLSYYADTTLALRLRTTEAAIIEAREELITYDLVAYQAPLTQVLSLPKTPLERSNRWS